MSRIEWGASFSVNNTEIDNQHKQWIKLYNELHESLMGVSSKELDIGEAIKTMQDYANYHFKYEEQYMKEINYPALIDHIRMHKDFDDIIYKYARNYHDGNLVLKGEITQVIQKWLLHHILHEDKKYKIHASKQSS